MWWIRCRCCCCYCLFFLHFIFHSKRSGLALRHFIAHILITDLFRFYNVVCLVLFIHLNRRKTNQKANNNWLEDWDAACTRPRSVNADDARSDLSVSCMVCSEINCNFMTILKMFNADEPSKMKTSWTMNCSTVQCYSTGKTCASYSLHLLQHFFFSFSLSKWKKMIIKETI